MDTSIDLSSRKQQEYGLNIKKKRRHLKKAIKQNWKLLRRYNLFFSCKDEKELEQYKKDLRRLFDETLIMGLAYYTRT